MVRVSLIPCISTPAPPSKTQPTLHVLCMQRSKPPIKTHLPPPLHLKSTTQSSSRKQKSFLLPTMAKLIASIAALFFLVAVVNASIYRTTITTTEFEGVENPKQKCREQIQRQDFSKCERFIRQCGQQGEGEIVMRSSNPRQQQEIQGCCQQLSQVEERCRCKALKQIVMEQQQQGQIQGEQMQEVMQTARNIPQMCRIGPGSCDWQVVLV